MIRTARGAVVPDTWLPFVTPDQDGFEEYQSPMWDTRTYVDNTTTSLAFFPAAPGATTDLSNYNMPLTEPFLLKAIGVFFKIRPFVEDGGASAAALASQADDMARLINTGWLDIGLSKLGFGPFPLWKLGAGGGLWGMLAASGAEAAAQVWDYTQIGSPNTDGLFKLARPIIIPPSTSIPVTMKWGAAVDTIANYSICVYLDGISARK